MLSPKNRSWLDAFQKKHGRMPRVLHIGNIANNAYNNAKILNEAGLENHVICYDYYHIMGCPEWEDADFDNFFGDQFKPEWYKLNLNNYARPEWFIQAPLSLCLRFLNSQIVRGHFAPELLAACLTSASVVPPSYGAKEMSFLLGLEVCIRNSARKLKSVAGSIYRKAVDCFGQVTPARHRWRWFISPVDRSRVSNICDSYEHEFGPKRFGFGKSKMSDIRPSDCVAYISLYKKWKKLAFQHFDFIIAYSTDPIWPLLCGINYFAFEHGTIREIPYQQTPQGRLTALAYRKARHVFVTNFDCRASAEFLAPGRYTMINHPFDEDHGQRVKGWEKSRRTLQQELDSDLLLFHPTRQDWVEGTGYADKANDLFLKAFCELRRQGIKIGLVCCEWGSNVESSKQLIAREKCLEYVKWVQPLPVVAFERTCLACDIVVDQFKLGSFGGVLFKAMAVGRPILTFLDEEQVLQQYAECPPVLNCRTQKEISDAVRRVFRQREELTRLGELSREWIKKHHGKAATVNAQVDQFRLFDLFKNQRGKSRQPSSG